MRVNEKQIKLIGCWEYLIGFVLKTLLTVSANGEFQISMNGNLKIKYAATSTFLFKMAMNEPNDLQTAAK